MSPSAGPAPAAATELVPGLLGCCEPGALGGWRAASMHLLGGACVDATGNLWLRGEVGARLFRPSQHAEPRGSATCHGLRDRPVPTSAVKGGFGMKGDFQCFPLVFWSAGLCLPCGLVQKACGASVLGTMPDPVWTPGALAGPLCLGSGPPGPLQQVSHLGEVPGHSPLGWAFVRELPPRMWVTER